MVFTALQSEIKTLSRQEKYRLVQFIVAELAEEEAPIADERSIKRQPLQQSEQQETAKVQAIDTFLRKWKGFLKGIDPDEAKRHYLQEKYQ
jgi:hypothetical protein